MIASGWPAATGEPMAAEAERWWSVTEADRTPLEPDRWRLEVPAAGSREPLRVDFGEPLDAALAARLVRVELGGQSLEGTVRLERAGAGWAFYPDLPWEPAEHQLRIDPELEDLAGNRLDGPFDRSAGDARPSGAPGVRLFRSRP